MAAPRMEIIAKSMADNPSNRNDGVIAWLRRDVSGRRHILPPSAIVIKRRAVAPTAMPLRATQRKRRKKERAISAVKNMKRYSPITI
jgi:hypothetical protein